MIKTKLVGPISTGTGRDWYEVRTAIPWAKRIVGAIPVVIVKTETVGDTVTIEYEVSNGYHPPMTFSSDPLMPSNMSRETRVFCPQQLHELDMLMPPNGDIVVKMLNMKSYTVAPLAGLQVLYE